MFVQKKEKKSKHCLKYNTLMHILNDYKGKPS